MGVGVGRGRGTGGVRRFAPGCAGSGNRENRQNRGLERESHYRTLPTRGNPRLSTLAAVSKAVGLRLTVETGR